MLNASKALSDNSVYIFVCLRLHSGDTRTAWASDGENEAVSITTASQSSEDKTENQK